MAPSSVMAIPAAMRMEVCTISKGPQAPGTLGTE